MNNIIPISLSSVLLTLVLSACSNEINQSSAAGIEIASAEHAASELSFPEITVYKSPTCGCCTGWVTYLEEEGFSVNAIDHDDVDAIKTANGLHDPVLQSCHTALVDGYVIEGHVPANDIERLLRERPDNIKGLTAPGMPAMSPGMGSRMPKDYAVISFTESGEVSVYSQY